MYIDLNMILVILGILVCIALGYLIAALRNMNKLLRTANELVADNKTSIHDTIKQLPTVVNNCSEISENVKDVTDVVTDVTAEFIVTKENMKSNLQLVTDLLQILRSVFGK